MLQVDLVDWVVAGSTDLQANVNVVPLVLHPDPPAGEKEYQELSRANKKREAEWRGYKVEDDIWIKLVSAIPLQPGYSS